MFCAEACNRVLDRRSRCTAAAATSGDRRSTDCSAPPSCLEIGAGQIENRKMIIAGELLGRGWHDYRNRSAPPGSMVDPRTTARIWARSGTVGSGGSSSCHRADDVGGQTTSGGTGGGEDASRERIEELVDPTTPFPLAGCNREPVGVAVATGIGVVETTECIIWASDATYRGGNDERLDGDARSCAIEVSPRVNRMPPLIYRSPESAVTAQAEPSSSPS